MKLMQTVMVFVNTVLSWIVGNVVIVIFNPLKILKKLKNGLKMKSNIIKKIPDFNREHNIYCVIEKLNEVIEWINKFG